MYLKHYQLNSKPFDLSPGPKFLWLGEKHSEALATLKYGVLSDMGFLMLTGDVGVGKTALIHRLISNLDPSTVLAYITDPGVSTYDFYRLLAAEYNMAKAFRNKAEFLLELEKFLKQSYRDKKRVLLIVDEAQRLTNKLLDEIRVLSNIELSDRKLINIFFVGQPEFTDLVTTNSNRAIKQRIAINYHIHPLTESETGQYIHHRMKVAGASQPIFEPDSIAEIYRVTGGYPRAINILCDHALVEGYVAGLQSITSAMIERCERGVSIRAGLTHKKTDTQPPVDTTRQEIPVTATTKPPVDTTRQEIPVTATTKPPARTMPLLLGLGILAAVLASFYLLLFKPSPPTQPNYQEKLAESVNKPMDTVTSEQSRTPETDEVAGSDASAETVDQDNATSSDGLATPDQPSSIIIAQAQLPTQALPASGSPDADVAPPRDIPPSASAPASPPDWANWQQNGADRRSSIPDDATITDDLATVPAASVEPAPGASATTQQADNQPDGIDRSATGAASAAETSASPSTAERQADSQARAEDHAGKKATAAVVLAGVQPKPTVNQVTPVVPSTQGSEATSNRQATTDSSTTTQSQAEAPDSSPPAPTEGSPQKPTAVEPPPAPTDASSEKAPPRKAPNPTLAAKTETAPQPASVQNGVIAASSEQLDVNLMEDRLLSFLKLYCSTYAAKNLGKFTSFFADNAIENGKPFQSLVPKYERNFKFIETIQYRIELEQFSYDDAMERIRVEGIFFLKWLPPDKKWRENEGKIFMDLKEKGSAFLVHRLDYHRRGAKKE